MPLSLFKQKLAGVCMLQSSTVSLQQYDKTPLIVVGKCFSQITINQCVIQVTSVVGDVHSQLLLLGRDWIDLLQLNVSTLINQATQNHHVSGTTPATEIMAEFSDGFEDQLGVLEIEANIAIDDSVVPRFHKHRPIPFVLKEKVEQQLQKQADEGELIPIDKSDWATSIVVVCKNDGGIRICGDFKVSINPFIKQQVYPLPSPEEMFSTLANGELYTKLDLARAYKQMEVQKEY